MWGRLFDRGLAAAEVLEAGAGDELYVAFGIDDDVADAHGGGRGLSRR
jgi:hypothetical protein